MYHFTDYFNIYHDIILSGCMVHWQASPNKWWHRDTEQRHSGSGEEDMQPVPLLSAPSPAYILVHLIFIPLHYFFIPLYSIPFHSILSDLIWFTSIYINCNPIFTLSIAIIFDRKWWSICLERTRCTVFCLWISYPVYRTQETRTAQKIPQNWESEGKCNYLHT